MTNHYLGALGSIIAESLHTCEDLYNRIIAVTTQGKIPIVLLDVSSVCL